MNGTIETAVIGKNVRFLRKVMGLSQAKLAEIAYCDIRQIRRFEAGTNSIATVNYLAGLFGVPAIDLISIDMEKVNYNPAQNAGF